ncbi:MAG: hypothetical protein GY832_10115, partial [Chloroflexi bacterium]|nr:hypothetical protein [Chloroflexota bacterium]
NAYVESENFDESVIDRLLNEGRSDKQGPAEEGSLDTEPRAEEFDEDELYSDWAMGGGFERDPLFVLDERHGKPWTLEELPMMEAWLTQNAPALSLIAEAVGQPLFRMPLLRHGEEDLTKNSSHRETSRPRSIACALCARAQYHIATGDLDGAIEDVITCKKLGRHLQQEGQTVPILIGIALETMADAVGIAGSLEHPPAKKQLSQLVDDLNNCPPRGEFQKALLSARYQTLDLVQAMAHGRRTIDDWDLIIPVPPSFGYDWSVFAGCVNEHY